MNLITVRAALSSRIAWVAIAILFCVTIVIDVYVLAPQGSHVSNYFKRRHELLHLLTYGFCLFVMLVFPHCITSDTSPKNKAGWILLFFFTGFYATEIYFVVRTLTGWNANGEANRTSPIPSGPAAPKQEG